MSTEWLDQGQWSDDESRRLGPDGLRWFADRVAHFLRFLLDESQVPAEIRSMISPDDVRWLPQFVAWYSRNPMAYCTWQYADVWRGDGWSNGAWSLDVAAVGRDFPSAKAAVVVEVDRCSSLDEWLERERKGTLAGTGATSGIARLIPEAKQLAGWRVHWREWEAEGTFRRRGKRYPCKSCGETFRTVRLNQDFCSACPEQVRKERARKASAEKRDRARREREQQREIELQRQQRRETHRERERERSRKRRARARELRSAAEAVHRNRASTGATYSPSSGPDRRLDGSPGLRNLNPPDQS